MSSRRDRSVLLSLTLLLAGCPGSSASTPDSGRGGDGGCSCPSGFVCHQGACVEDLGPCQSDDDCLGDSFCEAGRCVPYGAGTRTHDAACKSSGFAAEQLKLPTVRCEWTKEDVWSTPMVFDLDGDGKPELLFITLAGRLVALDGATCAEVFVKEAGLHYSTHLAVGDLDGDKQPEIVGIDDGYQIRVFDHQGNLKATADAPAKTGKGKNACSAPSLVNLDGSGPAEIVYGAMALRLEAGKLVTLFNVDAPDNAWGGFIPVVADVNLDGKPEVITGNRIFDGATGADLTPTPVKSFGAGFAAVAQLDAATKEPEIVLVSSPDPGGGNTTVRAYHPVSGQVVFGPIEIGSYYGGPPTVADFDGDGKREIAVAAREGYLLLDPKCDVSPLPAGCSARGIRWSKQTQDLSSGITGSSVFDFNGDGKAEVVYRDECWLRIYDGPSGKVLFAFPISSGTGTDMPVVADVDADGHAELVVPSNGYDVCSGVEAELKLTHPGPTRGVKVLQDPDRRWMPSRPLWNQHAYHITNVNDDGTIPAKETGSWESWNSYRMNVQGTPGDIPALDLTAHRSKQIDPQTDCASKWVLMAELCNRGAAEAPSGLSGAFYLGDPKSGGKLICSGKTEAALKPGECTTVRCAWSQPASGALDLWFVADDDGAGAGAQPECKEKNNALHLARVTCPGVID